MAAAPLTPRRTSTGRRRGRPPGSTNAARAARLAAVSSEPPPKRRKYIPGGPGGGGRFVDEDGIITYVVRGAARASTGGGGGSGGGGGGGTGRTPTARAPRISSGGGGGGAASSPILPRRERSTRTRIAVSRYEADDDEQFSSAAAVAAAVVQSEGYKPREERGWEEFHPNLDIETTFMVFRSEDVDGTATRQSAAATPTAGLPSGASPFANGVTTTGTEIGATTGGTDTSNSINGVSGDTSVIPFSAAADAASATAAGAAASADSSQDQSINFSPAGTPGLPETPLRRRIGRPPRDGVVSYGTGSTPKTPKVLPIHNQTPKEKLDLKLPSYRKTDRILLFEGKTFGRYVDKSMMNVGYQESDVYVRPERYLIKASDANAEEESDAYLHAAAGIGSGAGTGTGTDGMLPTSYGVPGSSVSVIIPGGGAGSNGGVGRVEYDMDEQDDMWLVKYNAQRKAANVEPITREIFEITITKIEKEWHALEKRIPKPNPKPPQTHRPRSSSAAAVNGETQQGEEQDSKCAICDDGDCENTNAIVFCDGCDLAVHQDCYGVPFIPEGQWLCRKCQLIGRGVPTCIFCPNTDGAFKQTNSSKWAHMLCAMWIPETSLGNTTFMEPVMDVDKVPKTRWRLTCYICRQKMGACIQCGNKACYQAFHVTCARRARLYLKMKNSQGALAVLDNSMILKAFCDRHCPPDYSKENAVHQATREAKRYYKRNMRGRIWADSRASALQMAATTHAMLEHPIDESQMTGARITAAMGAAAAASAPGDGSSGGGDAASSSAGGDKKKGGAAAAQAAKPMWKLPSGAPVIPQAVFDIVETALQRFMLRRRREFVSEACRYWTLKREARRGAALLKRLQLQMETFTSMELTRRNFATMGPSGQSRLERRIEFAESLIQDLEQLRSLASDVVEREREKLEVADLEHDFVNSCYFPIHKLLAPIIDKASFYDKDVFRAGFATLQAKLNERFYTNTLGFVQDLSAVMCKAINQVEVQPEQPAAVAQPGGSVSGNGDEAAASSQLTSAAGEGTATPTPSAVSTAAVAALTATPKPTGSAAYAEARDRKRLGKRILKSIQSMLEAAIRAESDITRVPLESLQRELEELLEASVELQLASQVATARSLSATSGAAEDTVMTDRPAEDGSGDGQTVVAAAAHIRGGGGGSGGSGNMEDEDGEGDKMDVDHHDPQVTPRASTRNKTISIEITTPRSSSLTSAVNGVPATTVVGELKKGGGSASGLLLANGTDGHDDGTSAASAAGGGGGRPTTANGPLTPPQSHNGSLPGGVGGGGSAPHHADGSNSSSSIGSSGSSSQRPTVDTLNDGGVLWFLSGFSPVGTTAVEEQWAGRDAVRLLSEDLTDMDDEELNGLGFDVEDNTITASTKGVGNGSGSNSSRLSAAPSTATATDTETAAPSSRNLTVTTPKRRGAAATTPFRKGIRSSARRR